MSQIIQVLPDEPRKALLALAAFRFLTPQQLLRLNVSASVEVIRNHALSRLERRARPLAKAKKLGTFLPKVHYLTPHGAEELAKLYRLDPAEVPYPKGQVQFSPMFARHRFAQVDFHIGLRQWAHRLPDADFVFADMDFDTSGARRHGNFSKKSEISVPNYDRPIVADGIFGVNFRGQPLLYVMEIHRTTQTKAVGNQLQKYIDVLATNAVNFKYGTRNTPTVVCSVHTQENVLKGAKEYLRSIPDYQHFKHMILFNRSEQLAADFSEGWHDAEGQPAYPFPKAKQPNETDLLDYLY